MSTESNNVQHFYDDVIVALRVSFTAVSVSGGIWTPFPPIDTTKLHEALQKLPPEKRRMIPRNPRDTELEEAAQLLPPFRPPYTGFQFVDIAHLGDFALIAFRWRESSTGSDISDEIFVHTVDLRLFTPEIHTVQTAEAIISTNLLEQLGGQWYKHRSLRRINGLTFIE